MSDAKIAKVLRGARERIAKPENWIKHSIRRGINGNECFCSYGAISEELYSSVIGNNLNVDIIHSSTGDDNLNMNVVYDRMCVVFGMDVVAFNDHKSTTHPDVMRMFDTVIKALEKDNRND